MNRFFINRLIRRKLFFLSMGIGALLCVFHVVWDVILPGNLYRETVYTKWIEALSSSELQSLFFMLLPILSAMAMAELYLADQKSGYLNVLVSRADRRRYFRSLYICNFVAGGLCILIPLAVNLYACFLVCPDRTPDLLAEGTNAVSYYGQDTLFAALYYTHPFLHVCLYLFLGFLAAGIFASFALALSFFVPSRFLVWIGPYAINYLYISLMLALTGKGNYALLSVCVQQGSQVTLKLACGVIGLWLLAVSCLYGIGVKKRVPIV